MKNSVNLTEMPKGYDGQSRRAEVTPWSFEPDPEMRAYDHAGLYLQFVEGCGYDVYYMTADEAEALAKILLENAAKSRESFQTGKSL